MNTELIVTPEVQAVLDAIKNTGKSWHPGSSDVSAVCKEISGDRF